MASTYDVEDIHIIELDKLNKYKYFPLVTTSGVIVRGLLYPFSLIKTRLQVQKKQGAIYKGTFDAFIKIRRTEGTRGLYKGFWFSNLFTFSQISYIGTFEYIRHMLARKTSIKNDNLRAFIAGGCASLVGQTFLVPIDIISQHLQMRGMNTAPLHIPQSSVHSPVRASHAIQAVYNNYGLRGFYRGYFASIAVYAPNSATWWFSYQTYYGALVSVSPDSVPRLAVQCVSAPLAGATSAILYTSLDAVRTRVQVENAKFFQTVFKLWKEERFGMFTKGMSARIIQSCIYSIFIISPYETIKRLSIKDEYKHLVRW